MIKHRFKVEYFVALSLLVVAAIFFTVTQLEKTVLSDAPLETLKDVYFARGSLAALAVLLVAILFIRLERRQTQLLIRKLSQAVEQSPNSVVITDITGRIEYVNPRFTRLTGYGRREAIGQKPSLLKSGKTSPRVYQQMWGAIASGRDWKGELLNKKKNGELYWESLSISPLEDSSGGITHYIGVLEDVTERKKIEKLKDQLISTVSHELRTPLAMIKWSIRDLEDGLTARISPDLRDLLRGMSQSVSRLEKVITEVLDLSRLESGKAAPHKELVDLSPLLHETIASFRKGIASGDVILREELPDELVLEADPDMILQVVTNLVENALRFARSQVILRASEHEGSLSVSVLDDGPGIAPDDQRKLFSKFERISRPGRRDQYRGTGLGLSICREIIAQHNGQIWVESLPGQVTEFCFKIPQTGAGCNTRGGGYGSSQETNTRH